LEKGISEGTIQERITPLMLEGMYGLHWKDYSDMKMQDGKFKYLLVKVKQMRIFKKDYIISFKI